MGGRSASCRAHLRAAMPSPARSMLYPYCCANYAANANYHQALIGHGHGAGAAAVTIHGSGPGQSGSADCNRHTLSGCGLLAIRLLGPQRQLVVPRGKSGRVHGELSQLICDRLIKGFAVAQQFYSGAWSSSASDNSVTRWPDERNIERRYDLITAAQRTGRNAKCGRLHGRVGSLISNARCRRRNRCRGDCVSGFH